MAASKPTGERGSRPCRGGGDEHDGADKKRRETTGEEQLGERQPVEVLKVSSRSSPNSVAGALAGVVRQQGAVHLQVIGAGALNQAIKAIAIARGYVAPSGIDLVCVPTFADVEIDGESRTALRLTVENREPSTSATSEIHLDVEDGEAGEAGDESEGDFGLTRTLP